MFLKFCIGLNRRGETDVREKDDIRNNRIRTHLYNINLFINLNIL